MKKSLGPISRNMGDLMDCNTESQLRSDFRNLLGSLAKCENLYNDEEQQALYCRKFENLYSSKVDGVEFRHFYSDIFSTLTEIKKDQKLGNIEYLGMNIDLIRRAYESKKSPDSVRQIKDIRDNLRKLYDHISLDIARLNLSEKTERNVSSEKAIQDIKAQVNSLYTSISTANTEVDSVKKEIKGIQKEYITILGIFASIVLAFIGGIAFSTSVLQNIHNSSIYRIVFVSSLIGLVVINVLYSLFFYIDRIVNDNTDPKIFPIIIANIILVAVMLATFFAWTSGAVEQRNAKIEQSESYVVNDN